MSIKKQLFILLLGAIFASSTAFAGATLNKVKSEDILICGVNPGTPGFGAPNERGEFEGLDIDYCKALAIAILGDSEKIRYVPLTAVKRLAAVQSGEIDVLARNTTWTLSRDVKGLEFIGVNFYDGQGFMVKKDLDVTSAKQLDGAAVCVEPGTTTELNLADYFRSNNMSFKSVVIENVAEAFGAFVAGRCDVYTTDASGLAAQRSTVKNQDDYIILPEIISKEPLGPVVRQGDTEFSDIGRWVLHAMFEAEELGVTSENVDDMLESTSPSIQRLLGVSGSLGSDMGLDNKWAYNIIKEVGNYGESYERNVTPIGLDRGINALWKDGGLIYPLPLR